MSNILTIDCGTTSTRSIVFDKNRQVLNISQESLDLHHPKTGWVEQDPNEIWLKTLSCLTHSLSKFQKDSISAIAITNQRETAIIWDKDTGVPIGPAISWQCKRTSQKCNEMAKYSEDVRIKTGLPLDPYFSATKFVWLINHYPESQNLLKNNKLGIGTVDTWLLWNLTNGKSYATDITNASRTLLYNIKTLSYDQELCQLFNIPIDSLPSVFPSCFNFGNYSYADDYKIPIYAMIGDQQSALFAQCGRNKNMIKNTYGTGLFMMANTGQYLNQSKSLITTIAIGINDSVDYAVEGSIFTGSALLNWLTEIGILNTPSESESLAKSVNNSGGVSIIPALSGLGAPHWKPDLKGIISGLTRSTSKAHISRAALESIVFQTQDVLNALYDSVPNKKLDLIKVDGGAAKNDWLMQLQADISNIVIERPSSIEATALGAALCAANYKKIWPTDDSLPSTKFSPLMSEQERKKRYSRWVKAVTKSMQFDDL